MLCFGAGPAHAQVNSTWNGASNNNYNDASNWTNGVPNGVNDDATIPDGTPTAVANVDVQLNSLSVGSTGVCR